MKMKMKNNRMRSQKTMINKCLMKIKENQKEDIMRNSYNKALRVTI